jgi:hypothetical protein
MRFEYRVRRIIFAPKREVPGGRRKLRNDSFINGSLRRV